MFSRYFKTGFLYINSFNLNLNILLRVTIVWLLIFWVLATEQKLTFFIIILVEKIPLELQQVFLLEYFHRFASEHENISPRELNNNTNYNTMHENQKTSKKTFRLNMRQLCSVNRPISLHAWFNKSPVKHTVTTRKVIIYFVVFLLNISLLITVIIKNSVRSWINS